MKHFIAGKLIRTLVLFVNRRRGHSGKKKVIEVATPYTATSRVRTYAIRSKDPATSNAVYALRFVAFPFKYYASIMLGKPADAITQTELLALSERNPMRNKHGKQLMVAYKAHIELFLANLDERKKHPETAQQALTILNEEIFHHAHTHQTSSWIFSNIISLFYRGTAAYCTYYWHALDNSIADSKHDKQVWRLLINLHLIRTYLATCNVVVIEAFFHYKDIPAFQLAGYDNYMVKVAETLAAIDSQLRKSYGHETDGLMLNILQLILNYPFENIFSHELSYKKFRQAYNDACERRLHNVHTLILANQATSMSSKALIAQLNEQINTADDHEKTISQVFHYAEYLPLQLLDFLTRKIATSGLLSIAVAMYWRKKSNKNGLDAHAYKGMPGLHISSMHEDNFIMDPAMLFFNNHKQFENALPSFEAHLLNDLDKKGSFVTMVVNDFALKAITNICFLGWEEDMFIDNYNFTFSWIPRLQKHQQTITTFFLKDIYTIAYGLSPVFHRAIDQMETNGSDVASDELLSSFKQILHQTHKLIDSFETPLKSAVLDFCDANYGHGM